MDHYLIVISRDASECGDADYALDVAGQLVEAGHKVTTFLVQNAVFPARVGAGGERLEALIGCGSTVLADEFSLRERGIDSARLRPGVLPSLLDTVIERMAAGDKVFWY